MYKGHQVFLYKRAQIFVADLWGAFKGQGYGEFYDIGSITMFADYVVPAVLEQLGVLKYSSRLANIIETNNEISSGSEEEVELRACSVYAVEKMRELIRIKSGKQVRAVCSLLIYIYFFQRYNIIAKKISCSIILSMAGIKISFSIILSMAGIISRPFSGA